MASLRWLPNSRYAIACFTGADGRRYQRSTKETDKKRAQKIADQYEECAFIARRGLLTERQARKVIADIFQIANRGQALQLETIGHYFRRWLESKRIQMKSKAFDRYAQLMGDFLKWIAPRSSFGLGHLSSLELAKFRDYYAQNKSPSTVNTALAVIQTALQDACNDHLIDFNEATRVKRLEETRVQERRPFTREEFGRILAACDAEWKGMVLTGLYVGGLRIGDVADLCWENVDLATKQIRLKTEKTGKYKLLPIAGPLYRYWKQIAGPSPRGPLFPKAYGIRRRNNASSQLSNQFYDVMVRAGLVEKRTHHRKGEGRNAKRQSTGLGFHCLRYTATSMLKNAGVSDAVTREIIGHESAAVSRIYSRFEDKTLADALAKLPDFF
jgi:integrase